MNLNNKIVICLVLIGSVVIGVTVPTIMNLELQDQLNQVEQEQQQNIATEEEINKNLDSVESSLLQLQEQINSNQNTVEEHHNQSYLSNTTWYMSDQTKLAVAKLKIGDCYDGDSVFGNICKVGTYP